MVLRRWGRMRPRRLVLVAAAALVPVLAGCEAGNNAPTLEFHYPTDAAGTVVGQLSIRNVHILGGPLGKNLHPGQSASLFLSLINDGSAPDRLVSISAPGTATSVSIPAGGIPLVLGRPAYLSGPMPKLVLENLTRTVTSGSTVRLVLNFQKAGAVTLIVPVFPHASHYQTLSPPAPTASPTPSASPSGKGKHGSPKPGASKSPTPTPSATG